MNKGLLPISIPEHTVAELIQNRLNNLTKPPGSLGRLEEFARAYCVMRGTTTPGIRKKYVLVFAGDHGITEEGVSAYPKEVTHQMVFNFLRGGAGVNVLARHVGAQIKVVDVGVDYDFQRVKGLVNKKVRRGTGNFLKVPAMTKEEALKAVEAGMEITMDIIDDGADIIAVGDMGIGNTTPSSAITAVVTGAKVEDVTGRGTGIDDSRWRNKVEVIKKAIQLHKPVASDGIDILSKIGGLEIGAIAGAILASASRRIPVVLDGFITTAGALIACLCNSNVKHYLFASHRSVEQGHKIALDFLGLNPILDLNLRLGEGTGACLAMSIIEAGVKILNEMATFDDAGVSKGDL